MYLSVKHFVVFLFWALLNSSSKLLPVLSIISTELVGHRYLSLSPSDPNSGRATAAWPGSAVSDSGLVAPFPRSSVFRAAHSSSFHSTSDSWQLRQLLPCNTFYLFTEFGKPSCVKCILFITPITDQPENLYFQRSTQLWMKQCKITIHAIYLGGRFWGFECWISGKFSKGPINCQSKNFIAARFYYEKMYLCI